MFQGPPLSALHQRTALAEPDSIMNLLLSIPSHERVILRALNMVNTSATLISIKGMGDEKTHIKCPSEERRTPRTAAWGRE